MKIKVSYKRSKTKSIDSINHIEIDFKNDATARLFQVVLKNIMLLVNEDFEEVNRQQIFSKQVMIVGLFSIQKKIDNSFKIKINVLESMCLYHASKGRLISFIDTPTLLLFDSIIDTIDSTIIKQPLLL